MCRRRKHDENRNATKTAIAIAIVLILPLSSARSFCISRSELGNNQNRMRRTTRPCNRSAQLIVGAVTTSTGRRDWAGITVFDLTPAASAQPDNASPSQGGSRRTTPVMMSVTLS